MNGLDHREQLTAAELANRAPSPHNIQPARWRFRGVEVELLEAGDRWLAASDPSGRDNRIALGMAWEGMAIALSHNGYALSAPTLEEVSYPTHAKVRLIAKGRIQSGAQCDAFFPALESRHAYRGKFNPVATGDTALEDCLGRHKNIALALDPTMSATIAEWYDEAAVEGLKQSAVAAELYEWTRFNSRDPAWRRDGLSADCLGLSAVEARAASWLLNPPILAWLNRLRLTKLIVSEAAKVKSAARILCVIASKDQDPFDTGRAWYRMWLDLEMHRYVGVPMSALSDSSAYNERVSVLAGLDSSTRLVNIMRIGPKPPKTVPRSARLPAQEVLLG